MDERFALALLAIGAALYYTITPAASTVSDKLAFVRKFGQVALDRVRANGWPTIVAPLLIAWAAMESAWGTSELAQRGNNVYGIKAGPTWKAQGSPFDDYVTREFQGTPKEETITASFRHYADWAGSLDDLLHMLSITTIYKPAYDKLAQGDYTGFFQAIDASGYSTAANYSGRIKNFLNDLGGVA